MGVNVQYWYCSICNVVIPMFRPYPDMWKKRIENHFYNCHPEYTNGKRWKEFLSQEKNIERKCK